MPHHAHQHSHCQNEPKAFNRPFAYAVTANFVFVLIELFYASQAHSMSLFADAAHNLGDVLSLLLAWGANFLLQKQAKQHYSYGYKRATILAALCNGCILLTSSALIAYGAIYKLFHLSHVYSSLMISVAAFGILVNGGTALLFMRQATTDLNIKGAFLHLLYDTLISFGVVLSGICIYYTGKMWIDPVVSLLIVFCVLWGTWGLLKASLNLILDATPEHINDTEVKNFLLQLPNIVAVHDLHIWGLSTKETAMTVHLVVDPTNTVQMNYYFINQELKKRFHVDHVTIQTENQNSDFVCGRTEKCY